MSFVEATDITLVIKLACCPELDVGIYLHLCCLGVAEHLMFKAVLRSPVRLLPIVDVILRSGCLVS